LPSGDDLDGSSEIGRAHSEALERKQRAQLQELIDDNYGYSDEGILEMWMEANEPQRGWGESKKAIEGQIRKLLRKVKHRSTVDRLARSVVASRLDASVWMYQAQPSGKFTMTVNFSMPVGEIGLDKFRDKSLEYQREVYDVYRAIGKFFSGVVDGRMASHEIRDWVATEGKVIGFRSRASYTGTVQEEITESYTDLFSKLVHQVGGSVNLTLSTL